MTKTMRLKFWVNLTLVIATTYIIVWYIFTPSDNKCQMTFMMEPPKFIPVPLEGKFSEKFYTYSELSAQETSQQTDKYRLYMYSEFGFPQTSNIRHDLRDSMPVLFVPGNAGSFQQVRSLASTCIRRQLQSLDAFKFVFYTIDFGGRLSGIDGKLIDEQTTFVQQSLNQIANLHPSDTNGIIVIGHSVGGFISKVLFTREDFDTNSVPLLISLASPLKAPFITFDKKMQELYSRTNKFWKENRAKLNNTVAISISGGNSDRLVPMHLSMDSAFDLSLATNSLKDVWLETDHLGITWCKELILKLSHLLSSLMDKKQTRLIDDKEESLRRIKYELLVSSSAREKTAVIQKDWKTSKSRIIITVRDHHIVSRNELLDKLVVLNLSRHDYIERGVLIRVDHIQPLNIDGIFGCANLSLPDDRQTICHGKISLNHLASVIPSRRFEPKKTMIKLKDSISIKYIIMDFLIGRKNIVANQVPESVSLQRLNIKSTYPLTIPTLLEFIIKKLLLIDQFEQEVIVSNAFPFAYSSYKIDNLKHRTQVFSLNLISHSCSSDSVLESRAVLSRGETVEQVFYATSQYKDYAPHIKVKLNTQNNVLSRPPPRVEEDVTVEFYLDGTCENRLSLELDILSLLVSCIQKNLGRILGCVTFLGYFSMVLAAFDIERKLLTSRNTYLDQVFKYALQFCGFTFVHLGFERIIPDSEEESGYLEDNVVYASIIFLISQGAIAHLDYFLRRIVDLAIIMNNIQTALANKVRKISATTNGSANGCCKVEGKLSKTDFDWILIIFALLGGLVFSEAVISFSALFILIKLELSLIKFKNYCGEPLSNGALNKHLVKSKEVQGEVCNYTQQHDLLSSVAIMCALGLVSNVPTALLKIRNYKINTNILLEMISSDTGFSISAVSLILIKLISQEVEYRSTNLMKSGENNDNKNSKWPKFLQHMHILTMLPILMIESNMQQMNLATLISMFWLLVYLNQSSNRYYTNKNS